MSKNPLIIFEGTETSGKSTNLNIAVNYLKKKGKKFIKLREPGGTKFSEKIRKIILNKNFNLNYKTDLMLFYASRSENFEKIIKKNYKKKIILIDRFTDSTIAYQHFAMKVDLSVIRKLNKFITGNFKPNFTFLSIVNSKNLKKRLSERSKLNKYDKFDLSFYSKVQKGYLKLSKNKKNYIILDSNKNSINEIKNKIVKKLKKYT